MYLIRDDKRLVILDRNPTHQGFSGAVETDVNFYYPPELRDGTPRSEVCVGVSAAKPNCYRGFRSAEECREAGYKKVAEGAPAVFRSWRDYLLDKIQHQLMPEHAQEHVAINLVTGEYVLARTSSEAFRAFEARWPNKPMFASRVDGGPSVKMRTPRK